MKYLLEHKYDNATISRTGSKMTHAEKFLTGLSVGGVGLARWQ